MIAVAAAIAIHILRSRASNDFEGMKSAILPADEETIKGIMSHHESDLCLTVHLTDICHKGDGLNELMSRHEGDPVHLRPTIHDGKVRYDTFSGGYKIGTIEGKNAEELSETLNNSRISGAYICTKRDAMPKLLVFYKNAGSVRFGKHTFTIDTESVLMPITVCQN